MRSDTTTIFQTRTQQEVNLKAECFSFQRYPVLQNDIISSIRVETIFIPDTVIQYLCLVGLIQNCIGCYSAFANYTILGGGDEK